MDTKKVQAYMNYYQVSDQSVLFFTASDTENSDAERLAAALLLCTCDSNERKAGE